MTRVMIEKARFVNCAKGNLPNVHKRSKKKKGRLFEKRYFGTFRETLDTLRSFKSSSDIQKKQEHKETHKGMTTTTTTMFSPVRACVGAVTNNNNRRASRGERVGGEEASCSSIFPGTFGRRRSRSARGFGGRRTSSSSLSSSSFKVFASLSEEENRAQIADCKKYVSDLTQMNMKLPLIRRYVAGAKNDLKLLQSFQDMLAEKSLTEEDEDEEKRREKVLLMLNDLRLEKAEEEQFWLERGQDKVTSSLTDNAVGLTEDDKVEVSRMLATGTMFAVQGAVWNAILLLLTVAGILLFVGRGDVNVATPGATGTIGY